MPTSKRRLVQAVQANFEQVKEPLDNSYGITIRICMVAGVSNTLAPHKDSIAIRVASGKCHLEDVEMHTPAATYLVVNLETAFRIRADRLMVVENRETFRHLEKQRWIQYDDLNDLAIFCGDMWFSTGEPPVLLNSRIEPVWAFYDFDTAGLALANLAPRLVEVFSPPVD